MTILVTGVAGFIGSHLAHALLDRGRRVVGVDNLNDYYDPVLKQARLARLEAREGFAFHKLELADREALPALCAARPEIEQVAHMAAQAGVRYSLINPFAYVDANVTGQLVVLEACRRLPRLRHLVYASSSSVYGANEKLPFAVEDRVDHPVSLYAATKRSGELVAECYARLHRLPMTGLRSFTVYGPWGRPDMSPYLFTKAIFEGKPIQVFNKGKMRRDFTYIDDIVAGVLAALETPPEAEGDAPPHRIYNLGNHRSEDLMHFIAVLERACGREAVKEFTGMQPGDVEETYADIETARRDLGFEPKTTIEEGIPRFVEWFREYHGVKP
ncbi:MAG: NAD-dependent epimerase/dehydratase family protein [Rhodospirillales bacterium]|nr:NAD-dependent epimerase/dehydratase family protein [Rhodospirillales bacterium]